MSEKIIVPLIIGLPSVIGMFCILYSIFYERDIDDNIQYIPKQPIPSSHDQKLVIDTEYYLSQDINEFDVDDKLSIFDEN